MKSRGQALVLFIICIPALLLLVAFITDSSLMTKGKIKLESVTKSILNEVTPDATNLNNKIKELYRLNEIDITGLEITNNNTRVKIVAKTKIKSIFGKVIGKDYYNLEIKLTGIYENDKIKIEKE